MSNFIVAKGLGGSLLLTQGYGDSFGESQSILKSTIGNLIINVYKQDEGAVIVFNDGNNVVVQYFELEEAQQIGEEYFMVFIVREGDKLYISVDKSDRAEAILATPVNNYGEKWIAMENKPGGLFDLRILPRAISKKHIDYYMDSLTENAGKELLP